MRFEPSSMPPHAPDVAHLRSSITNILRPRPLRVPEPPRTQWRPPTALFDQVLDISGNAGYPELPPAERIAGLIPFESGSSASLFRCVIKRPEPLRMEVNGDIHTNAPDVITQFLAELRVYRSVGRHHNIAGFVGCIPGVGMVLEQIEGQTLLPRIRAQPPAAVRVSWYNQLLDGLAHIHSFDLSHGDLNTLNIIVTPSDTIKLIDFGRSVGALEKPQVCSRPFTSPELLRGDRADGLLCDAYALGMLLVCIDMGDLVDVDPAIQRKNEWAPDYDQLKLFASRVKGYLDTPDRRTRISIKQRM